MTRSTRLETLLASRACSLTHMLRRGAHTREASQHMDTTWLTAHASPPTSSLTRATLNARRRGVVLAVCAAVGAALLTGAAPALAETCPNEQLRAEDHSTTLPDCRAYEMVTPPFKEAAAASLEYLGNTDFGLYGIAPDGLRVDVNGIGDFGDAKNGYTSDSYELTRTESGWTEENIDLPQSQFAISTDIQTGPELEPVLYSAGPTYKTLEYWLREPDGAVVHLGEAIDGGEGGWSGASADLTHVVFSTSRFGGGEALEDILGHAGAPVPVGVEPDGSACAASFVNGGNPRFAGGVGASPISANGSTVYFYCSGRLFARIDNGEPGAHTVAISMGPATFQVASPDGNVVFYLESGAFQRYDIASNTREEVEPAGAGVSNVVTINGTGEDGAYLYFRASGALTGANSQGHAPVAGEPNLYLLRRDAEFPAGRLSFIGTTVAGAAQATPDGRFLVFTSTADLTSGDTSTASQLFEYDAQSESLVRVSVGQDGFNDNGNTDTFNAEVAEFPVVSDNGEYVAFQSADALTPGALVGEPNVYEYHGGNVYLISDGQRGAVLRGVSASGGDIFFETTDQLVTQDTDTQVDLYDARVDGGFPAAVSSLPTCQGDACQGELSAAPILLSPGSEFQAGVNPPLTGSEVAPAIKAKAKAKPAKCKKGYMKSKRGCVKVRRTKKAAKKSDAGRASNDRRAKS
jgi:hypothetical protein